MKTFNWAKAGANAGLRLSILNDSRLDQGLYQACHVLSTFRRLAKKQNGLLHLWEGYMDAYQGQVQQGPFAKMLEICQQLRWSIHVPDLCDRHGNQLPWLTMEDNAFYKVLQEAWSWKILEDIRERKDMTGLYGLDRRVIQISHKKLLPHQRSTIQVLQDGTFVEERIHAKYDLTKDSRCPLCQQPDSLQHRCISCPALRDVYTNHVYVQQKWPEWSDSKKLHLLPSANPHLSEFRGLLLTADDHMIRTVPTTDEEMVHLFTDGSCIGGSIPLYTQLQIVVW